MQTKLWAFVIVNLGLGLPKSSYPMGPLAQDLGTWHVGTSNCSTGLGYVYAHWSSEPVGLLNVCAQAKHAGAGHYSHYDAPTPQAINPSTFKLWSLHTFLGKPSGELVRE